MVLWNQIEREKPRGISIGKEGSTEVLKIPQEFDNIKHYGVDCELITVEVGIKFYCRGKNMLEVRQICHLIFFFSS